MRLASLALRGRQRLIFGQIILLALVLCVAPVVNAASPISESYKTSEKLALGTLVSLEDNSTDTVVPANNNNVSNLFGVVVNEESSLLRVKSAQSEQALVQVANSGTLNVLVSDINGPIYRGDHITASPISGVGMKATGNVKVIGIAQGDLKGVHQPYKDETGADKSVMLGQIATVVNVAFYFKEPDKTLIPTALQKLADSIAGKSVNAIPILISLGIFVVMLIVVASIIYSMIRGSILSVGRNPMAQSAVYRNLIQLSALVLVILGVGFGAMYLVITRVG